MSDAGESDDFGARFDEYMATVVAPLETPLERFASAREYDNCARAIHTQGPWFLYVCKDGTLTVRETTKPRWDMLGVPVFAVSKETEALMLQGLLCSRVNARHPFLPEKEDWYRLHDVRRSTAFAYDAITGRRGPVFRPDDLPRISAKMRAVYSTMVERTKEAAPSDLFNLHVCGDVWGRSSMVAPNEGGTHPFD